MEFWFQLLGTVLFASLILLIFFKLKTSKNDGHENSLDSKRKGTTVLITGLPKSGKTALFQKLVEAPKILKTAPSLKPNISALGRWKVIDSPLDSQKLHSQPADFFHFNELAAIIICIKSKKDLESELDLVIIMSFAVGVLKEVPVCLRLIEKSSELEKEFILTKLLLALNTIQKNRLASLLNVDSASTAITFDDPINRLIFETSEGEVSSEYESHVREYFDHKVTLKNSSEDISSLREWLD